MVPVLVYDGDCGFCSAFVRWYEQRGTAAIACRPWQTVDLAELGLDADGVRAQAWLVEENAVLGGARAIAGALRVLPGGWGLVGRALDVPVARPVAAAVYRVVAHNRSHLPGATDSCATRPPPPPPKP